MDGLDDLTKDELYERAQEADIEGRSEMTKDELIEALTDADTDAPAPAAAPVNPLRPPVSSTGSQVAPVPGRADQPGLGRASVAERDPRLGPTPNVGSSRIGEAISRRRALREESVAE